MRTFITTVAVLSMLAITGEALRAQTGSEARPEQARDMRLVGHEPLQGRSAYQPVIVKQGDRFIAYVGHHGGATRNPLTGSTEPNGTSIVDVTDAAHPRYLHHLPGSPGGGESGGAPMVRVCHGRELPHADPAKTYLLRTFGSRAHELWDVTDPSRPSRLATVVDGLGATHKNWWECDRGIAYLVSDGRPSGWRTNRMTKIYDLGDPTNPVFIRDFGRPGQEPGSTTPDPPPGVHGPIAFRNRVYFAYGTSANGAISIVDRDRLLRGNPAVSDRFAPTADNLRYPEIGRLEMSPGWGGHTAFPLLGVRVAEFAADARGGTRDFVFVTSEALANECQESRHLTFVIDVTTEARPMGVATFQVPASPGDFCHRGGRFGPHATNESFTPRYYGKLVFVSYFNAGVRAVDVRNPFAPREVAFYVPATTAATDKRCVTVGAAERCKMAIQTNNVEVDDRGLIYLADRANTGLHIVELAGTARTIAGLP